MLIGGIADNLDAATMTEHPARMWVLQGKSLIFELQPVAASIQKLTVTGAPTEGTFKLQGRAGTTDAIAIVATAAEVQDAIAALPHVGVGNVTVTGGPGPSMPWYVEFVAELQGARVAQSHVALEPVEVDVDDGEAAVVSTIASPGGPLFLSGTWTAECQIRTDFADFANTVLLAVPCTVSAVTGFLRGEAEPADTDAVVTTNVEDLWFEIEATNQLGQTVRVLDGPVSISRTVVRS